MRSQRVAVLALCMSVLVVAGCSDSGEGDDPQTEDTPGEEASPPETLYGTADLEQMVVPETEGPEGLELDPHASGPISIFGYLPDEARIAAAEENGFQLAYVNEWIVQPPSAAAPPKPVGELKATRFISDVGVFETSEGASAALSFFKENGNPAASDRTSEDVSELGEEAFASKTTFENPGQPPAINFAYQWRVKNALGLMIVTSSKDTTEGGPPEELMLAKAQELAGLMEETEPTGEAFDLPPEAVPGEVVFEDDFSDEKVGWTLGSFPGEPPGSSTNYADGQLRMTVDKEAGGGRFNDTGEIGKELADLTDTIIEVDAENAGGQDSGWGLVCREQKGESFYAFIVRPDGSVVVVKGLSPSEPFGFFLNTSSNDGIAQTLSEPHTLRADCIGDDIARLSLYLNDEKIGEGFDDDPFPSGAAGLWAESEAGIGADILFDNFSITEAAPAE
jgi:hypothetical protein